MANLNLSQAGSEATSRGLQWYQPPLLSPNHISSFPIALAYLPPHPSHHAPLVWEPKLLLLTSARPTHQHSAAPSLPLHLTQVAESNPTVLGFHTLVPACNAASAHRCGGSSLPAGERSKQQERLLHQGDLILFILEQIRDGSSPLCSNHSEVKISLHNKTQTFHPSPNGSLLQTVAVAPSSLSLAGPWEHTSPLTGDQHQRTALNAWWYVQSSLVRDSHTQPKFW